MKADKKVCQDFTKRDITVELQCKKWNIQGWEQGQGAGEEFREVAWGVIQAKAQL